MKIFGWLKKVLQSSLELNEVSLQSTWKNIYDSGELNKVSTCAKFAQVNKREIGLSGVNLNIILNENQRAN